MSTGLIVVIVVVALDHHRPAVPAPAHAPAAQSTGRTNASCIRAQAMADGAAGSRAARTRARRAERKANIAQQAAERERAKTNMQRERADLHERGMADDELIEATGATTSRATRGSPTRPPTPTVTGTR